MNSLQSEVWRKFGLSILRWVLILIGSWLIKHGVVKQDMVDSITTPDALLSLLGVLVVIVTTIWQWGRSKYSVTLPEMALKAPPNTPMDKVKSETKEILKNR